MPLLKPSKDLFSKQSKEYAVSRPTYPSALFDFIVGLVPEKKVAWDCATGNGQAAVALSAHFKLVLASDLSEKQIENASTRSNIRYEVFPAEKTPLQDDSVDLITVAQALHWFDFESFYAEAKRVMRRDGVIAAWAYGLHSISPKVDEVTHELYENILGEFWPPERRYIEAKYSTIPFPFDQFSVPEVHMELEWDVDALVGYFHSWSSVQKFIEKNNQDPVAKIIPSLREAWGNGLKRRVVWPMYVKAGRSG